MTEQAPPGRTGHLAYLDCVRGYAVAMVIACHAAYEYPGLPWPAKRLATSGWFGVQLFFLASCVTLLMSWHAEGRRGGHDLRAFALRRLFRIVPAYYLAIPLYLAVLPPRKFDWDALAHAVTFTNAWDIRYLTAPGSWGVVPGGWSVSVEIGFYVVFPLYALVVTDARRAAAALVAALAAGAAANRAVLAADLGFPADATGHFLFFWLPNQASVFALGGLLFFLLPRASGSPALRRAGPLAAAACVAAFCAVPFMPLGLFLGDSPPVPQGHVAAVALAGFMAALAARGGPFTNRLAAALGRASFSAYLIHFAVLAAMRRLPGPLHRSAEGPAAVAAYAAGLALALAATYVLAGLSAAVVERPMIATGRRVIAALPPRRGTAGRSGKGKEPSGLDGGAGVSGRRPAGP